MYRIRRKKSMSPALAPLPAVQGMTRSTRRIPTPVPVITRPAVVRTERRRGNRQPRRVTPAELLAEMNTALLARPECAAIRLGGRRWEVDPAAEGCNWSESSLIVRVHGTAGAGAFAALRAIIADARARFDVSLAG